MVHKQLSDAIPKWLIQGIVLALLAIIAGGAGTWVGGVNHGLSEAVTASAVQETKIDVNNDNIIEMKNSLRRIEDKIDNLK